MKMKVFILCVLLSTLLIQAQTKVSGYIKGFGDKPIYDATVTLMPENITVNTDKIGYYQFKDVAEGLHRLNINSPSYAEYVKEFSVTNEAALTIDDVILNYSPVAETQGIITLTEDELADDESQNQSGISLLQSSRDVFSRTSAFELGGYWFKARGLDNRYVDVYYDGTQMNKEDNGSVDFGNWGGLNDITRYPLEIVEGSNTSPYYFGTISSSTYFNASAGTLRKGFRLTYSNTNRSYRNRLMLSYFSGMNKKGWSFAFSASRRWAEEGRIDGTYYDAYSYFFSVEKKFSSKNSLSFTTFGAPGRRSSNSPNTQEVYDLMGKDYNSYWGWYEGVKRNERVKKYFEPIFLLTDTWTINDKTSLKTTLSFQTGTSGSSRLDWFNAASPSPTYYRNLPSYAIASNATPENIQNVYDRWKNDTNYSQINWLSLYSQNLNAPTGTYGGITGKRASYYMVSDKNDDTTIGFNTHFEHEISNGWNINANFSYQRLLSKNYREVLDLMGADFVLNLDDFNNNASYGNKLVAYKGDKIQYDYYLTRNTYKFNFSNNWDIEKFSFNVSTLIGYTDSQRNGKFLYALYPNNSLGKSEKVHFVDVGLRAMITYKFNGRHFLRYSSTYNTLSPTLNDIFFNPRSNNVVTPNITNQKINSNELSYIIRSPKIKSRLTGYYTSIRDAIDITRYYAQGLALFNQSSQSNQNVDAFVSEVLTNVDKEYFGGELGLEIPLSSTFIINAMGSMGQYIYKNNPNLYISVDDATNQGVYDFGKTYLKDYKLGSGPQAAASLGIRYSSPKYWWVGASGNYLANSYLDMAPLLRTKNFTTDPLTGNPYFNPELNRYITESDVRTILQQQKFSNQFMLNASIGKNFKFGRYYLNLIFSMNNILNNRNYVTGGFEQGRNANFNDLYDDKNRQSPIFAPKYWYDRGRNYFINAIFRF